MRIEKLLPPAQPGRPWTVALEGGKTLRVPEGTVVSFSLYTGQTLGEADVQALQEAAFLTTLRENTARQLSQRLLSTGQVRKKLQNAGATEAQAAEIVAWAVDIGLLNDEDYAKALARHYQARGYGLYKIKDELYRRQVPRACWDEALDGLEDPSEAIDAFLARRVQDPADPKQLKKASDALVRRGFSWRQVADGVDRLRRDL